MNDKLNNTEQTILSLLPSSKTEEYLQWRKKMYQKACERQGTDIPYFGAIGGEISFKVMPTSLGAIVKASFRDYGKIDLSDYDNW